MTQDGLVTAASKHDVKATLDRIEAALHAKGVAVFARVDHAGGARTVGMPLRPTELLIFGNPAAGTPLMQGHQAIGIDLPLKMLAWEDQGGKVWLTYNDPHWIAACHGLGAGLEASVNAMAVLLAGLAAQAAAD